METPVISFFRNLNIPPAAAVTVKNYSKFQPPLPRYNYKYSIFEYFQHSGSVFRTPLIYFLTSTFSTITVPFFVRKFLETKRFFEKIIKKFQPSSPRTKKFLAAAANGEKNMQNFLAAATGCLRVF
jgi:hypothetical protein